MRWPSAGSLLLAYLGLLATAADAKESADCIATTGVPFGSHYEPVTRANTALGKDLLVEGRVRSAKDCGPLKNARVEYWQAGRDGQYTKRLRAYQLTDARGRFRFSTEWPALPPPHIHFRVDAPGHGTLVTVWKQPVDGQQARGIRLDFVLETR